MYGREKLEEFHGYYDKYDADKVMDAMERRMARLTAIVEGWKRNSVVLGDMYKERLAIEQARIKELESQLPKWKVLGDLVPKNKYLKFLILNSDGKYKLNVGFVREFVFGIDVVLLRGSSVISKDFRKLKGNAFYLEETLPPPPTTEDSSATEKEK